MMMMLRNLTLANTKIEFLKTLRTLQARIFKKLSPTQAALLSNNVNRTDNNAANKPFSIKKLSQLVWVF